MEGKRTRSRFSGERLPNSAPAKREALKIRTPMLDK